MIDKPADMTSFKDDQQVSTLNSMLDTLFNNASGFRYTNVVPTATTINAGEIVIYDDDAGTKRLYVITGQSNLGYIDLT